jgi:hypothetical protein
MEKVDPITGKRYTWCDGLTLYELLEKSDEIENNCNEFVHGINKNPRLLSTLEKTVNCNAVKPCQLIRGG